MAIGLSGKAGGLFKTSGLGAMAAAIAMMVIPAEAMAQNRGDRARDWQRSQQSQSDSNRGDRARDWQRSQQSQSDSNRGGRWQNRSGDSGDSRRDRAATRVENRGDRRAERVDNRSEVRGLQIRGQGDRAAARAASNGNYAQANRIDNRSERAARQVERRGDWRANQIDRRSERRADTIRNSDRDYRRAEAQRRNERDDRQRDWQRNRSYRDGDRNQTYREKRFPNARSDSRRWDRKWRNNNRYDWQRYRARNRDIYRLGRYYAPYRSYSYRRLGIGFYLDSLFFSSRYWISDPWQYRLPEVYGPYRWVRYYDDALLVDIYTGEVVDVIYDFFW